MKVTCQTIIDWIAKQVEEKQPISPSLWLEAASKLNALKQDETDKQFELKQKVNVRKAALITAGKSVAAAKVEIEATDDFKEACKQEAKVEQIEEFIRIAKKMSAAPF